MKLSDETLRILANFKNINPGLVVKKGNVIKTRHYQSPVPVVSAQVPEEFPRDFAIHNLHNFLSAFSFLNDPELTFTDSHIIMKDSSKRTAKIRYAAPSMVVHHDYGLTVKLPTIDCEVDLEEANLKTILKASGAFTSPEIAFIGDGARVKLTTFDVKNPGADNFELELGNTEDTFQMIVNVTHLQLMMRSYKVAISFKGLLQFTSETETNKLTYWVSASDKSKVG